MNKIQFKDLSGWLKALVILGWANLAIWTFWLLVAFIIGFISAL